MLLVELELRDPTTPPIRGFPSILMESSHVMDPTRARIKLTLATLAVVSDPVVLKMKFGQEFILPRMWKTSPRVFSFRIKSLRL